MRMDSSRRYSLIGHNSSRVRLHFITHALVELAILIVLLSALAAIVGAWWLALNLVGRAW